jgi:hypothetical protein
MKEKTRLPRCTKKGRIYWVHPKCGNPFPACVHIEQRNRMGNLWDIMYVFDALLDSVTPANPEAS